MNGILMILLKISLVIFMVGNLLNMGLRLNPRMPSGDCEMVGLCSMFGVRGSLAVISQLIFFLVVTPSLIGVAPGCSMNKRSFSAPGMATRNIGAALAPLFSITEMDQRAVVMVVLGFPVMAMFGLLSAKWFGRSASTDGPGVAPSVPRQGDVS